MSVKSCEKIEKSQVALTIEVGAAEFEAAIEKAYKKMRKNISVQGFRPGKAPRKMIEKMYGVEVFYEEAINNAFPEAYEAAIQEQNLRVVGYPQVEMVGDCTAEGFTFKAIVPVYPEVTLGEYKGLTVEKEEVKVMAADVNARLKQMAERNARLESVERAAKEGDTAVIDFEGFDNGTAFEGGKGENYSLEIGSGSFVPGFEEQLVGMQIGEEKEINITFPENYHPELAGKPVIFKVKINEVKEPQTPAIDDEFAKDVSEFETLEELKKDLGEKLKARREEQAQNDYENAIMAQLIDNMEVEIPNAMIEVQLNRVMDDFNMRLNGQGLKMEDYAAMMGGSVETVREAARPAARRQVEMELAMTAIAKAENFQISDEEVEAELQKMATEFNMEVEKIKDYIGVEDLKKDMCLRKAADLVIAEAKIGEAPKKDEEKPKRTTRKKKVEETVEGEETAEKPKRTRKKKTEDEEPKAE